MAVASTPDSELAEIAGGTHGALIEYPHEIFAAIVDFVHRRLGHADADAVPGAAVSR